MTDTNRLAVGQRLPERAFGPLTRTDFVRYAGASGDFNPLHHDEVYAHGIGLPTVMGMGMLTAGLLSNVVTDAFPVADVRTLRVRFRAPVWPGETLLADGEVTARWTTEEGEELVTVSLRVRNEADETKITGEATAVLAA